MKTIALIVLVSPWVHAQLIAPPWRGEAGTEYFEWDIFTEAKFAPNQPDVTNGSATLICTTSSAFLTSSGNIYSFQAPTYFQIDAALEGETRQVFLQIAALGSGIDTAGAKLIFTNQNGVTKSRAPSSSQILSQEELTGERGGLGTIYWLQWDLASEPTQEPITVLFNASGSSLSLDRVSLEISPEFKRVVKPEPLTIQILPDLITVSWLGSHLLQTSSSLGPDDWEDVSESIGKNTLNFPRHDAPQFFRLKMVD